MIVNYYLPLVLENPPDELFGIFGVPTEQDINNWLESEIENTFPTADSLINKIQLEVNYKDVTFDTLNGEDFLKSIKEASFEELLEVVPENVAIQIKESQ